MAWVDFALLAEVAERQHAVFDGANPVQSPLGVNDGLGVRALGEGFGGEIDEKFGGELLVSGEILGGEDYDARGEAVAQSVQTGGLLPGVCTRTRTLLSIAAVGFYLDDALTIALIYKARWQVELFFKWIKQH